VGSWFEDNTRRVVGNGRDTFFGQIIGLTEFRCELNFVDFMILPLIESVWWQMWRR